MKTAVKEWILFLVGVFVGIAIMICVVGYTQSSQELPPTELITDPIHINAIDSEDMGFIWRPFWSHRPT